MMNFVHLISHEMMIFVSPALAGKTLGITLSPVVDCLLLMLSVVVKMG